MHHIRLVAEPRNASKSTILRSKKSFAAARCAVVQFCGEVLDQKAMSRRGAESLDYAFCLQSFEETEIYEKLAFARNVKCEAFSAWRNVAYIDPTRKGNIARFISHGCFPNLVMLRYAENDLRLNRARAILFASQPILGGSEQYFQPQTYHTVLQIMKKSLAYFAYLEKNMVEYDTKAKRYLRKTGIVRPEYDDLDEANTSNHSGGHRIDPACVHKRDGDDVLFN
ncbi:SET domain protein [Ancylostoma duodenale]|uniref:SET domain protein n=1 Tax=Ancylostoma duodenale TaxID=51022 RepID=A0A0C2GQF1_9BILA|nr:SET domain protein [Ancylostoma duodenale]